MGSQRRAGFFKLRRVAARMERLTYDVVRVRGNCSCVSKDVYLQYPRSNTCTAYLYVSAANLGGDWAPYKVGEYELMYGDVLRTKVYRANYTNSAVRKR